MAWGDLALKTPTMYAPPQVALTIIDGIWSPGEWADTPQYTMKGPSCQKGFIRAKFNQTHLLVLIDSPWDTTPSMLYYHENVWLAFDTLNNGGPIPMPDDYLIHASTEFTQMGWVGYPAGGTGNWTMAWLGWAGTFSCVQAGGAFGFIPLQPSPNSATPHRISELAIPLVLIEYSPQVGFYAMVDDDSTDPDGTGWLPPTSYAEWPAGSGGTPGWPGGWGSVPTPAPMAWGDLILAPPPAVHDIAVTLITPSKTIVGQTFSCHVNVTLANQGASAETFEVTLYEDDISLDTKSVTLASGSSTIVTFDWNTVGCAKDLMGCIIRAYAWPVMDEMDTMDNSRVEGLIYVAMPGDVAGGGGAFPNTLPDGRVEILDLANIAIVYGVNYPDQRYVPNFDIDGNGRIEILDLALASMNYGRIDP